MKSNLTEKLLDICGHSMVALGINNLTEEQLIQVEAELIKHFEFDKIIWMEHPSVLAEDNTTPLIAKSIKISDTDNPTYKHKVGYIHSIMFTPKMYEPGTSHTPVKDGCVFAPTTYNPETYEPTQSITLTWSPDFPQNINAPQRTYEDDKQMIRDILEKVLNSPEDYRPVSYIGCLLRFAAV